MADKTTIKNRIEIEGEAQYRKAMREITAALNEQRSALKAASAEYDNAADEMKDASAIGEALEETYAQQSRKLEEMQKHLAEIEKAYAAAGAELATLEKGTKEYEKLENQMADVDIQAIRMRTSINNMRAEMAKSAGELRNFKNGLGAVDDVTDEAAQGIREVAQSAEESRSGVRGFVDDLSELTGMSLPQLTLSAAVAGAGAAVGAGLSLGDEQNGGRNWMAAYTGASGEALDDMVDAAKGVFNNAYVDSFEQAAQGVAQVSQNLELTGERLQAVTESAFMLDQVFGMSIPESTRTARQMMENFGVDAETAYDIMATAAQNGADKNGNLLDTINEYAPYFAQAGYSAEEFGAALSSAAENGIYDVDKVGDGFKEMSIRVKENSEETQKALKALGIEATDLPAKFAEGGEAARAASELIIEKLKAVQDPVEQNKLGVALFGTQWEDTGGKILEVLDAMSEGMGDVSGALDEMKDARFTELGTQVEGLTNRLKTLAGEAMAPVAEGAARMVAGVNAAIDSAVDKQEEAAARAAALTQAVTDERVALDQELARLNEEIAASDAAGDWAKSAALIAERDVVIAEVASLATEVVGRYKAMGGDAVTAVEDTAPDMHAASADVGAQAVSGAEEGLEGMYAAGEDGADGVVDGLESGISSAYAAGWQTGKAYERGYKNALDQHSPSRVMLSAAQDTVRPVFDELDDAAGEIYARGQALGDALSGGYAASGGHFGAERAGDGGEGITPEALAGAISEALSGMGLYVDGERLGGMRTVAGGVSRTIGRSATMTMAGAIAQAKRW